MDGQITNGHIPIDFEGNPEHLLEMIADNMSQLDQAVQGAFLQRLLKSLTSVNVTEKESVVHWQQILARRNELEEKLGRKVSLRTAAVDYLGQLLLLRNPILLEYEELKTLRFNAAMDSLTGLNNRRMFEEYLDREINRSGRYHASFALLLLDLRSFKSANDTYGHATGDEILRSVARACVETIRGSDISCRIGGDEFALLLPQAERSSANALADRIAGKFEEYAHSLAPTTPVGIDYGIAIFPEDGSEAAALFHAADKELYKNKQIAHRGQPKPDPGPQPPVPPTEELAVELYNARAMQDLHRLAEAFAFAKTGVANETARTANLAHDRRKYERTPLVETRGLGVLRLGIKSKIVKLLDLSRGGVCLSIGDFDLPESFLAFLKVPFLPDAEITLHRIHSSRLPDGKKRIGCSFTSTFEPQTP
jgi:diguanylate cyclase (GGDEF)-like protein